jgi:hypothetical protein
MADEYQAGKMILSQISLFNEAANLFGNVVEPAMLHAIDECTEVFAKDEQWVGTFELGGDDDDCWLAPAQWNVGEDNTDLDRKAWFAIDNICDDDDYWTALFCNQGRAGGEAGFMFGADEGTFGKKMAWNRSFSKIDQATTADLKKLGFKIVENNEGKKTFFLPVHLDAARLAEIWGTDGDFSAVDSCFEPVKIALEKIKTAWPIFDAILKNYPVKI